MYLSELWPLYEADKRLLGYSEHTLKGYRIQSSLLIRHLGDMDINELTTFHLKQYLIQITDPEKRKLTGKKPLQASSIGHRIRFIRSFCRYLHDEGMTDRNLAAKLQEPKLGQRIPKTLTQEEIELLRDACCNVREKAVIEFFYSTGVRIGEAHHINKADIKWETRSIRVIGKGNKEREVFFSRKCAIWLKKYIESRKDDHEALFVTERKPIRRLSISQLRANIKKVAKHSEVETNVYPHRWRHSFATTMLNNDCPMEVIMLNLGHARISTTMLYAQYSGEKLRQLHDKYFR